MPRQTSNISTERGQRWVCDNDGATEYRPVVAGGSPAVQDESARVAGWTVGYAGKPIYCPRCNGRNPGWKPGDLLDAGDPELAAYLADMPEHLRGGALAIIANGDWR
jgi:hypothetical protein